MSRYTSVSWIRGFIALVAGVALTILPNAGVQAYSGLQTPRDEEDACCTYNYMITYETNVWTGYDYSYGIGLTTTSPYQAWESQPSPSPTYECPVVFIPNVNSANAYTVYTAYHSGSAEANQVTQAYARGTWLHIPSNYWYTNDYLITSNPGVPYNQTFLVDVVEFHYESNHQGCTY